MVTTANGTKVFPFDTSKIPAQRRFMESTAPELLYSGSFGAGKSRVGCEKAMFLSLRYRNNVGIICRRTFASLRITTMRTWFQYVCPPSHIANWNQETHICQLTNGSQVIFLGLDDPLKIGSLEIGWAFIDEAVEVPEEIYDMIQGRLRLPVPFHQLFMATNPASPSHYLYRRFYLEKDSRREVIESDTLSNPFLPSDYIERLRNLKGRYRDRYVLGKWVGYEGLVYDNVDPQEVLCTRFEIPSHWTRYRSIDFGYTNPFVCQWWAAVPEAEACHKEPTEPIGEGCHHLCSKVNHHVRGYYLYREIYYTRQPVEHFALQIRALEVGDDNKPLETFADWDAEDRATLESKGIPTTRAYKGISTGIQTCYSQFTQRRIHILDDSLVEEDELLRDKNYPTNTIQELSNYRWASTSTQQLLSRNEKEVPRDKDNHGMDALRYFITGVVDIEQEPVVRYKREAKDVRITSITIGLEQNTSPTRRWSRDPINWHWER